MSRRHRVVVGYLIFTMLASLLVLLVPAPAQATTFFEEDFTDVTDCAVGSVPTGWVLIDNDVGLDPTAECRAVGHNAVNSMFFSHQDAWAGIVSPTISGTSATESLTVGFWINVSSNLYSGQWIGGVEGSQECTPGFDDRVKVSFSILSNWILVWNETAGDYDNTGEGPLLWDTWVHVEWIIDEGANTYSTRLDGVVISSGAGIGFGSTALTRFKLCMNAWANSYTDEVVVGAPVITSTAVTTGTCNGAYSYQAVSDASEDETWTLTVAPSYLSIGSSTGLITGTPTVAGVDSVTVQVETSAGTDTQAYSIAVGSCGGGGNYRIITGEVEADPADFGWYYGDFPEEPPDDSECDATTLTITFEDKTIVEGSALSYIWDFGDGTPVTVSSSSIVVHTFPEFEEYTITLALMLSDGSIFRQEQTLKLGECVPLFLGEPIQNIMAGIIASAVVLWMTFILTRKRPVMIGALLATLIGVSGWSLLLGF